jgi:pimeloyl-ACP methyl ester carboxylesterase
VLASHHGLDHHRDDVDCVVRCIARATRPVVLVGHSYAGGLITAVGTDGRVCGLVYIAALGLDEEEASQGQQDQLPKTDIFGQIEVAEWRVWMFPEGIDNFARDLTDEEKPGPLHDRLGRRLRTARCDDV